MYVKELAVFGLSTLEMVHDVSFVQHGTTFISKHCAGPFQCVACHQAFAHACDQALALMLLLSANFLGSS